MHFIINFCQRKHVYALKKFIFYEKFKRFIVTYVNFFLYLGSSKKEKLNEDYGFIFHIHHFMFKTLILYYLNKNS